MVKAGETSRRGGETILESIAHRIGAAEMFVLAY